MIGSFGLYLAFSPVTYSLLWPCEVAQSRKEISKKKRLIGTAVFSG